MKLYTIGFTKKSAEKFFTLLQKNNIKRLNKIERNMYGKTSSRSYRT